MLQLTGQETVPNIFINQKHIGGAEKLEELQCADHLNQIIQGEVAPTEPAKPKTNYDYDLVVIGGGSGGLSASKVSHYAFEDVSGQCCSLHTPLLGSIFYVTFHLCYAQKTFICSMQHVYVAHIPNRNDISHK